MESNHENSSDEIDIAALAFQYLDRSLQDAERKALNDRLRHDREARSTFIRCLIQGVELEELLSADKEFESLQARPDVATGHAEDGAQGQRSALGEAQDMDAGEARPRLTRAQSQRPFIGVRLLDGILINDQGRVNVPLIFATIAAAMVFGAGLGIWVVSGTGGLSRNSNGLVARDQAAAPGTKQSQLSTAVLVNVTNCRWDRTRSTADLAGGGLKPGQSLHLLEGLAEIQSTLPGRSLGKFQLEGPSAMTLSDDGMPNLLFGKLSGEFSCRRDSFRVGTSLGQIVISGDSSLGVRATADEVEVHVFSGQATLDLWSKSTTSDQNQLVTAEAGTSLRVRAGADGKTSVDRGAASENEFVTPASLAASQLVISDRYVSAIRESKPVAYWRFEEARDGLVRNEIADRFHLRLAGNAVRLRSSQGTRCAEFGISAGPGYMMTDDVFDNAIEDDYSVELWAKPTCFHHGALFSLINWTPDVNPKGRHRVYLEFGGPREWDYQTPGGMWESDPGRILFINGRSEPYSSAPYAVRKWQHLVALREGSNMKLYADGRLILTENNSEKLGSGMRVLIGQLYPPSRLIRDDVTARLYSGELDEVALYHRALSEAEIHKHLELTKSDAKTRESI
jgi:hypothetical protein